MTLEEDVRVFADQAIEKGWTLGAVVRELWAALGNDGAQSITIHLVTGHYGSHSDYEEWFVRAFIDADMAADFCARCEAALDVMRTRPDTGYNELRALDPCAPRFSPLDSGGYSCSEVLLGC